MGSVWIVSSIVNVSGGARYSCVIRDFSSIIDTFVESWAMHVLFLMGYRVVP